MSLEPADWGTDGVRKNQLQKEPQFLLYKLQCFLNKISAIYLASADRHDAVEGYGEVLLFVSVRRSEYHHSVFDGRAIEVVQADGLWAG